MNLIKFFVAVLLLVFSSQSLALFMPGGVQVNTDSDVVTNDVGCWVFFNSKKRLCKIDNTCCHTSSLWVEFCLSRQPGECLFCGKPGIIFSGLYLNTGYYLSGINTFYTVTGQVLRAENLKVGEFLYEYPVIQVDHYYLWPPEPEQSYSDYPPYPWMYGPYYPLYYPYYYPHRRHY